MGRASKKLVALGSDGASVMMGARKGVVALLKEKKSLHHWNPLF